MSRGVILAKAAPTASDDIPGSEHREAGGPGPPRLAELILDRQTRGGKGGMAGGSTLHRAAGRLDNMIDRRFLATVPLFDKLPGRTQLFHRFLPTRSATI